MKYNYEFTPQGHLADTVSFADGSELKAALVALELLHPLSQNRQVIAERVSLDLVSDIGRVARGYRSGMHFAAEEAELLDEALASLSESPDPAYEHYRAQARFMIRHAQTVGLAEEPVQDDISVG